MRVNRAEEQFDGQVILPYFLFTNIRIISGAVSNIGKDIFLVA